MRDKEDIMESYKGVAMSTGQYKLKELYEGYYWLILHTDPYHGPDGWRGEGGYIIPRDYWKSEMPDCVKTAIEEHTSDQPLKHTIAVDEKGYHYHTKRACFIDGAFSWFTSKNIPLLNADGKEIKSWRDLRRLWGMANTYDSSGNKIPLTQHNTFKKAAFSEELYHDHCADVFHALESYLESQHRKNLKELKIPGKRYFIRDILKETGIKKTLFYDLRKKKKIPQHYDKRGNSPYWLEDGYNETCKYIKKHHPKS